MRCDNLERHKTSKSCKVIVCDICQANVPFLYRLQHKRQHEVQNRRRDATPVTQIELPPYVIDPDYEDIYVTFKKHIESYERNYKLSAVINFQLHDFSNQRIAEAFDSIFRNQSSCFKVSISFSFILFNIETGELAFYWASRNNQRLFDDTYLIASDSDFRRMKNRILNVDLQSRVTYPSTKFVFVKTTNVVFYLTRLVGTPIGATVDLPDYLKNNKGLVSLVRSANNKKKLYSDNLCFFRCLALFNGFPIRGLENETKHLFRVYCEQALLDPAEFDGILLDQLEDASRIFGVGINVYHQKENRETEIIFRSLKQDNILYLNLFADHFSYISDFSKYCNSYKCIKCIKIFNHNGNYKRHLKTCDGSTREMFFNGIFRPTPTIFEELELHGVNVPSEKRTFPYRITFDCEVYLTTDTPEDTARVKYSHKHNLASISVCSNVPDFEHPKCFISNGSSHSLAKDVISYMLDISEASNVLLTAEYDEYMEQIDEHKGLCEKFELYLQQIPVLGFNNAKYDLKVMRDFFIPALLELDLPRFIIKKGTSYNCIATASLRFLDICNYLAPGFDYNSFLKAYGASAAKSWFPYEWFDDLGKLENTDLPTYDSFYSSLKSRNTLEPVVGERLSEEEIGIINRRPDKNSPLQPTEQQQIGLFRYRNLQVMFTANSWTMREYLEYYNNLDVTPFVEALENFSQYYVDRGVDIFKDAISGNISMCMPHFS